MTEKINILERGEGDAIVLVSGLGGLASFWEPTMEVLSRSYRVITFDHPGVGGSSIDGAPTIPGIVHALSQVLDKLGVPKAHIVGHSTGSLVTQSMALDHPERVRSMVLSSGWAHTDKRFEDFFAYRKYILAKLGGTAYTALTRFTAYPSSWYGEQFAEEGALDFDADSTVDAAMSQARMDMLLGYSRRDALHTLKLPALVIGASDDFIIPFHHSEELASLIPGAKLVELSGGHFAPVTRTQSYAEKLSKFWESLA